MLGSVRESLHHPDDLGRRPGVPPLLHTQGELAEVARRVGGDETEDLVCQLLRRQLSLGQLDATLEGDVRLRLLHSYLNMCIANCCQFSKKVV